MTDYGNDCHLEKEHEPAISILKINENTIFNSKELIRYTVEYAGRSASGCVNILLNF